MFVRTLDGRPIKLMVVIDENSRECLAIHVARRIRGNDAIDFSLDLMEAHRIPEHIRSGTDAERVAKTLRNWLERLGTATTDITPRSSWKNGYCESLKGKIRDDLLNGELFYTIWETHVLTDQWWFFNNTKRPLRLR